MAGEELDESRRTQISQTPHVCDVIYSTGDLEISTGFRNGRTPVENSINSVEFD
jgi:hypothetical protein